MTRENLITVKESVDQQEAKRLLHKHRIEKLLVVDPEGRCVGLITVKDIEKSQLNPNAAKDAQGRLRARRRQRRRRTVFERAERLIDAGVDLMSSTPPTAIRSGVLDGSGAGESFPTRCASWRATSRRGRYQGR